MKSQKHCHYEVDRYRFTEAEYLGLEKIEGDFRFERITAIPEGFNPNVIGSLYFSRVTDIPFDFTPVCQYLEMPALTHVPAHFKPAVKLLILNNVRVVDPEFQPRCEHLYMGSITKLPDNFSIKLRGNLCLSGLIETPLNFKAVVGGDLHLYGVSKMNSGFDIQVDGKLIFKSLTKAPGGGTFRVKGNIDFYNLKGVSEEFQCSDQTQIVLINTPSEIIDLLKSQKLNTGRLNHEIGSFFNISNPQLKFHKFAI